MAQFASDSFTNSSGTVLTTHSSNWVRHTLFSTNCEITDANRARASAVAYTLHYRTETPNSADYDVSCDVYCVTFSGRDEQCGVVGRCSTTDDTYYRGNIKSWSADELRLTKFVAGVATLLGSAYAVTLATSTTYQVKLEMVGSAIKLYLDGTQRVSVTDTAITAAGRPGIQLSYATGSTPANNAGLHIDNFSADQSGIGPVNLSDAFTLADSGVRTPSKILSDSVAIAEALVKTLSKIFTDAITIADSVATFIALQINASDSFTFSDATKRTLTKVISDALVLTDILVRTGQKKLSDPFSIADSVTAVKNLLVSLSDAFSVSDSSEQTINPVVAETIVLTIVEQHLRRGILSALAHFPTSYVFGGLTHKGVFNENRGAEVMLDAGYQNRRGAIIVSLRDVFTGSLPARGDTITIGSTVWRVMSVTYDRIQVTIKISSPKQ